MDNAVIVEVCDSGEGGTDELCGVELVVAAFSTYSVEELSAKGKVGNKVYYKFSTLALLWVLSGVETIQLFIVSK